VVKAKETLTTWSRTHGLFTILMRKPLVHSLGKWDGKQNLRLVNFVLESHLPFVQISSFYQKMTAKAWNWYQDPISQMEHKFLFGTFHPEKQNYLFRYSVTLCLKMFHLNKPKSCVAFTFPPDFTCRSAWLCEVCCSQMQTSSVVK